MSSLVHQLMRASETVKMMRKLEDQIYAERIALEDLIGYFDVAIAATPGSLSHTTHRDYLQKAQRAAEVRWEKVAPRTVIVPKDFYGFDVIA